MYNLELWSLVGLGFCIIMSIAISAASVSEFIREVRKNDDLLSENRHLAITLCSLLVTLVLYTFLLVLMLT